MLSPMSNMNYNMNNYLYNQDYSSVFNNDEANTPTIIKNPGESTEKLAGKKSSPAECETCSNR